MKRFFNIFCATAALMAVLSGCQQKTQADPVQGIELRYRVADSYDLPATGAAPFTIWVVAAEPWFITSAHPEWSMISEEEGEGQDWDLVHTGKGIPTAVTVQYYDNPSLDDREDELTIACERWLAKKVTVRQKGCAFLTIPEESQNILVDKDGGRFEIPVQTNQNWTAQVTEGDWVSIVEGASGSGSGTVVVEAEINLAEMRYARIVLYDRKGEEAAQVSFTQDGIQLDPEAFEIRAAYNQLSVSLNVTSNTRWSVKKSTEADTWYDITGGSGEGDGTITLSLTQNDGDAMRTSSILLSSIAEHEGDFVAEKEITIKQACQVKPEVHIFNNEELANWNSQGTFPPSYVSGSGMLFVNGCTLQCGSMPFGDYVFYWKDINAVNPGARFRVVFAYSDIEEMKFGLRVSSGGKNVMYLDFNAASSGKSGKPAGYDVPEDLDFSVPHTFACRFLPVIGSEYCHVSFYLDEELILEFDTSEKILDEVKWGTKINMYLSVDSGGDGDSAVLEKYEYFAPLQWDD